MSLIFVISWTRNFTEFCKNLMYQVLVKCAGVIIVIATETLSLLFYYFLFMRLSLNVPLIDFHHLH